jgi:hypothetical protein
MTAFLDGVDGAVSLQNPVILPLKSPVSPSKDDNREGVRDASYSANWLAGTLHEPHSMELV